MVPMPLAEFLADDYYTGTIEPIIHGDGKQVALGKSVVQWVLGGMFFQVMRGMVEPGIDRSGRAIRRARALTDEVLRALPPGFDLEAVEAAAIPVLSGLYQRAGDSPGQADTFAAELVANVLDDLRDYTGAD